MTYLDLVATLIDELDNMIAEFRLDNLRHLLRVGEVESHVGKGRIEHATTSIVELTALAG